MEIEVLFFAIARERAGLASERLALPPGATVAAAVAAVVGRHPTLEPLLPHVRWALNEAFVRDLASPLAAGDVLAAIPPVAGGAPAVALTAAPLDPRAVEAVVTAPDRGGLVTFIGLVRDHTGPHAVVHLEYEAYAAMAERVLEALRLEATERWPGTRAAIHHRLGRLEIGEAAVVVAVSAPHRAEAFAACAWLIERLKAEAPIFKKEVRADGSVWVGLGP